MSAEDRYFFDTNILVYLFSADDIKSKIAETVIEPGGVISVQVLNELTNVARRKMAASWDEVRELTTIVRSICTVQPITADTYDLGVHLSERYSLSVYDAMIVASAIESDCNWLLSEDMHNGLVVETNLTISNPFA